MDASASAQGDSFDLGKASLCTSDLDFLLPFEERQGHAESPKEAPKPSFINLMTPPGSSNDPLGHITPAKPVAEPAPARILDPSPPKKRPRGPRRNTSSSSRTKTTLSPVKSPAAAGNGPDSGRDKLNCRRGRNRYAAQKCRVKKKKYLENLEAEAAAGETANELLRMEADALRDESLFLKRMLLQHGTCNCELINAYIQKSASTLLEKGCLASPPDHSTKHNFSKACLGTISTHI